MAKRDPVRYAVIGLGELAQSRVLPAFEHAENSRLVALVSDDNSKLTRLQHKYGVPHGIGYRELEELFAFREVDAAYLTVPTSLHRRFAERCARSGVHVLCERPMAVTVEDCEAMIGACQSARRKLMIAYRLHFEQAHLRALELAQAGRLGELRIFSSTFSYQIRAGSLGTQAALGGGPSYNLGVTCINAARSLFRDEPLEVTAFTTSAPADPRFREVEEQLGALLRFPRDRLAQITVSFSAAPTASYEIIGSDGHLRLEDAYDDRLPPRQLLRLHGHAHEHNYKRHDQFAAELVYFSDCILHDDEPEPSGVEGLADVRVVRALFQSAATGQAITLGGFERARHPERDQEINVG